MIERICPFFKKCGGCLYQDLPFDTYLEKKKNFIERAFSDRGITIKTEPIQPVPIHSRRRACFAFRNGRSARGDRQALLPNHSYLRGKIGFAGRLSRGDQPGL